MLMLGIYDKPPSEGGALLLDATPWAMGGTFTTGEHGDEALTIDLRRPFGDAFRLYEWPALMHVALVDGALVVWEGRLEQPGLHAGADGAGLSLTAYGYWAALSDVPTTALWSTTSISDWQTFNDNQIPSRRPEKFNFDQNNRLFIAPKKNQAYALGDEGALGVLTSSGGIRKITRVTFDYALTNITANWEARLVSFEEGFGTRTREWFVTGSGVPQSGTVTVVFATPRNHCHFGLLTTAGLTYTAEDGDHYLKITNVRITTSGATIGADEIGRAFVSVVRADNPTQLAADTSLIQSPALDLRDFAYADEYPADILTDLAERGDSQSPPRRWEVGVESGRRLYLRPQGDASNVWTADADELELSRSLDALRNSAYAVYEDASGTTVRSATNTDASSVARYGVTRRAAVEAKTTSSTQATAQRDTALNDQATLMPQARLPFRRIYDASGIRVPLWRVRAGDTIIIRNLPPTLGVEVDRIRRFRITHTEYDLESDTLTVEPEQPKPTLETAIAGVTG